MSAPRTLSPEELLKCLLTTDDDSGIRIADHIAALEAERDAALAATAALVMAARGPLRDAAEPNGTFRTLLRAVQDMGEVVNQSHPGAALLEEHRKALVRARNEGLEKAAAFLDADHGGVLAPTAQRIRALKEPEA